MRAGRYTLRERLGAGGMGEVWLATDEGPHGYRKTVVIKRMLPEAARFLDYFTAEARLGARLVHQNIVQVLDFFEDGDKRNIVMEYVEGANVLDLTDRKPLTPEQAVYIAAQALKGLEFAHNATIDGKPAAIVHRDLSPDNILISCDAEVKVSDFGIAKASVAWRKETEVGFKGKWGYVSPEALLGKDVDRRADVYALGIVLYEMLARRRAFPSSSSAYHMTTRIVEGQVEPLEQVAPEVPKEVVAIVERMIRPQRDERMATAGEAREVLMRALPESVHAERPLAALVQELSAKRRRMTSPFLKPDEQARLVSGAPGPVEGIVMSALPDQETVKHEGRTKPESPVARAPVAPGAPRSVVDPGADTVKLKSDPVPAPRARRSGWWLALGLGGVGALATAVAWLGPRGLAEPRAAVRTPESIGPAGTSLGPATTTPPSTTPHVGTKAAPGTTEPAGTKAPATASSASSAKPRHHDRSRVAAQAVPPVVAGKGAPPAAEPKRTGDETGTIAIRGTGAGVSVDGVYIGRTPLEYEVSPGRHEVAFAGSPTRRVEVEPRSQVIVDAPGTPPPDARVLCEAAHVAYRRQDFAGAALKANQCLAASTTEQVAEDARRLLGSSRCGLKDSEGARRVARAMRQEATRSALRYVCHELGIEIP